MPSSEALRVFISYARSDGAALAQRLQSDLMKEGFDVWLDTQRISGGAVWSNEIEHEISTRRVTVALLSPGSYTSEICRAEQLRALDKGNRVIPVLAVKGADRPLYLYARHYRDFTDDANYTSRLGELVADIRSDTTATLTDTYRKTPVTYLTTPPRVANYLDRPEALRALRDAVFAEDHRQPIALTALAGMGGIGKTVLAKALTEDEVVQRAFPDGIVWLTAGKERKRDFVEEMREVAKALGDDLSRYDTALACENQYRTTIASKAALIVVDDVWSKADIEPLLAESPRSRFLFTTRNAAVGRFVGAHERRADLLDLVQSRELLASWAHLRVGELPPTADEIIAESGQLPLALSVLGAMLRGTDPEYWSDTLDLLRKADLSSIQKQLPEGQDSFFKAVEVSFQSLKLEMQERYKALAVLLEDTPAPLGILQMLWNEGEQEARRSSKHLVDLSLAQHEDGGIRLHDLQLDYVRAQYADQRALELIHGAFRLSSHVIAEDSNEYSSQMIGRLLPYSVIGAINTFITHLATAAPGPSLRPLTPSLTPPGGPLRRTIRAEKAIIEVSPDSMRLLSKNNTDIVTLWNLDTGVRIRTFQAPPSSARMVSATSNCDKLLMASTDGSTALWAVDSGEQLWRTKWPKEELEIFAMSWNGQIGVSVATETLITKSEVYQAWRAAADSAEEIKELSPYVEDDEWLKHWSPYVRSRIRVFDLKNGQEIVNFGTPLMVQVRAIWISQDSKRILTMSRPRLHFWDLQRGVKIRRSTIRGYSGGSLAISPDLSLALISVNHTLILHDLESGRELRSWQADSTSVVRAVAISADGQLGISANDCCIQVWELNSGAEVNRTSLRANIYKIRSLKVSVDLRRAVSISRDLDYSGIEPVMVWDLTFSEDPSQPAVHNAEVRNVLPTSNGQVVSCASDGSLYHWDLRSGRRLRESSVKGGRVWSAAITPKGHILLTSSDRQLHVCDLCGGSELFALAGHTDSVYAVAVSQDGKIAITGSEDKTLRVWDLEQRRQLRVIDTGHSKLISSVDITGDTLVSGSHDGTLKIWDLKQEREVRSLPEQSMIIAVKIIADTRFVLSSHYSGRVTLWDMDTGETIRTFEGPKSAVMALDVSPDKSLLATACYDGCLRVWRMGNTAVPLAQFTADSPLLACTFSSDSKTIVAGDFTGRVLFLALKMDSRRPSTSKLQT